MADDYYQILGVPKTSTADEIKRAYRKLALQYHPDRNKTKEADGKFKEVTKAYEVLSDAQKRKTYDQFGAAAFDNNGAGAGQGPFGSGGPFGGAQGGQHGPFSYSYTNGGAEFDMGGFSDPFEIFEQFFGGARQRRAAYSVTIDFMDAVKGAEKTVSVNGRQQKIKIPKGVDDGSRIRFDEYDLVVRVVPDKRFQREGADIITDLEVPFAKAAMGDTAEVQTVDEKIKVKIPSGTQPGTVMRLKEKGMPRIRGNGRGDHYVRIKISVPKHLTAKQKELLKEFDAESKKKTWF